MADFIRTPETTAIELLVLNAITLGLRRIDRKPERAGRPDLEEAIEIEELTWRDGENGPLFTWGGKEYAVHLEIETLNKERN